MLFIALLFNLSKKELAYEIVGFGNHWSLSVINDPSKQDM